MVNLQTDVENRSIFKQMFENTVHFQTDFEKIPLAPPPAAPSGRRRARRREYVFKIFEKNNTFFQNIWKTDPFFQNIWKKGPSIFF